MIAFPSILRSISFPPGVHQDRLLPILSIRALRLPTLHNNPPAPQHLLLDPVPALHPEALLPRLHMENTDFLHAHVPVATVVRWIRVESRLRVRPIHHLRPPAASLGRGLV